MKLKEGQIIEAPFISGSAEVKKFLYKKGLVLLEVILKDSNQYKFNWIYNSKRKMGKEGMYAKLQSGSR